MVDERTIAVYDAKAGEYAACFGASAPDRTLADFIALIPQGGHVLDLGCGPGTASAHMRDGGLIPDPIDASSAMVALARDRHGLDARQATFDAIGGTQVYDGIWANFSLLHAARADLPRHLAALAKAAKPGAILHIGMKTGTGAARDDLARLYTYVTVEELTDLVTTAGFAVDHLHEGAEAGLAGTVDPFVILRGHRNG